MKSAQNAWKTILLSILKSKSDSHIYKIGFQKSYISEMIQHKFPTNFEKKNLYRKIWKDYRKWTEMKRPNAGQWIGIILLPKRHAVRVWLPSALIIKFPLCQLCSVQTSDPSLQHISIQFNSKSLFSSFKKKKFWFNFFRTLKLTKIESLW